MLNRTFDIFIHFWWKYQIYREINKILKVITNIRNFSQEKELIFTFPKNISHTYTLSLSFYLNYNRTGEISCAYCWGLFIMIVQRILFFFSYCSNEANYEKYVRSMVISEISLRFLRMKKL